MDSFADDLNSPLPIPKQMQSEMMDDVRPSSLPTNDCAASTTSRIEGRPVIGLRPVSERLGRITLKRGTLAIASQETKVVSSEDPFRNLSDDILEHILARLPLFPLKAAKKVSKRWASVASTPEFDNLHKELGEQQPCLVGYGINHLVPSKSRGFAYDVENDAWVTLPALQFPAHNSGSLAGASGVVFAVAGPGEDRLWYKLTSTASSAESFGETWYETPVMTFPRSSPVVSVALGAGMGHKVVVAGGVPEFEDEHRAVEVFDSEIGTWESYGDLPEEFSEYNSRTWMSGVVCDDKFYVSLLHTLQIHVLDFYTKQWASIQLKRPEDLIYHHIMVIGTTLVVAGLCADSTNEQYAVKLWKVDLKTLSLIQIGLMPSQLLAMLGRSSTVPTLKFLMDENLVYVSMADGNLVVGEVSLEECKTYWRGLPSLSALGFRVWSKFKDIRRTLELHESPSWREALLSKTASTCLLTSSSTALATFLWRLWCLRNRFIFEYLRMKIVVPLRFASLLGRIPFLLAWLIGTTFSPISEDVVKSVRESFAKSFLRCKNEVLLWQYSPTLVQFNL